MTARARRRNPALWIVGNPGGRKRTRGNLPAMSETEAWQRIGVLINDLFTAGANGDTASAEHFRARAAAIARGMIGQVARGVHANPGKGTKFSNHVQAVVYQHVSEGPRAHGFGNAELDEKDLARGILRMDDVKEHTRVAMYAMPDGSVRLVSSDGKPLWREDP